MIFSQPRNHSIPVERGGHFLTLVRFVERNARRAGLVAGAEEWSWSSAHVRLHGTPKQKELLSPWPVAEPDPYRRWLNPSQGQEGIAKIREALKRSRPYGSEKWVARAVAQFGPENTMRNRGRPKKASFLVHWQLGELFLVATVGLADAQALRRPRLDNFDAFEVRKIC